MRIFDPKFRTPYSLLPVPYSLFPFPFAIGVFSVNQVRYHASLP
ncbi:hypothetical protein [Moorena sp. SIO3B2]|nr:hypothetical protein [Moorena sp. SIO3B2]